MPKIPNLPSISYDPDQVFHVVDPNSDKSYKFRLGDVPGSGSGGTSSGVTNQIKRKHLFNNENGIIWPLYKFPGFNNDDDQDGIQNLEDPDWWVYDVLDALKNAGNIDKIVVINPDSGPGSTVDSNYLHFIDLLHSAGCWVLGYVAAGFGNKAVNKINSDVDSWHTYYPKIDGIFFDESTNSNVTEDVNTMKEIATYARGKNFFPIVANPGTATDLIYWDEDTADIIIVYENRVDPTESEIRGGNSFNTHRYASRQRKGAIQYNKSELDYNILDQILKHNKWVFYKDDDLPNPYDTVPAYLNEFLQAMREKSRRADEEGVIYTPRTTAPNSPITGTLACADGSGWDPAGKGTGPYPVFYDGTNWIALF